MEEKLVSLFSPEAEEEERYADIASNSSAANKMLNHVLVSHIKPNSREKEPIKPETMRYIDRSVLGTSTRSVNRTMF